MGLDVEVYAALHKNRKAQVPRYWMYIKTIQEKQ
jgi:hypothetical protein